VVLDCYRLAHFYHVDPCIFLEKTISELGRHLRRTAKLADAITAEQEAAQPPE